MNAAGDLDYLTRCGIDVIVNVADSTKAFEGQFIYEVMSMDDSIEAQLAQCFEGKKGLYFKVKEYLDKELKVLIHCAKGRSR